MIILVGAAPFFISAALSVITPGQARAAACSPTITSVGPVTAKPDPTIAISGSCFGSLGQTLPYTTGGLLNTSSAPVLQLADSTANWTAGSGQLCSITIESWTSSAIIAQANVDNWWPLNVLGWGLCSLTLGDSLQVKVADLSGGTSAWASTATTASADLTFAVNAAPGTPVGLSQAGLQSFASALKSGLAAQGYSQVPGSSVGFAEAYAGLPVSKLDQDLDFLGAVYSIPGQFAAAGDAAEIARDLGGGAGLAYAAGEQVTSSTTSPSLSGIVGPEATAINNDFASAQGYFNSITYDACASAGLPLDYVIGPDLNYPGSLIVTVNGLKTGPSGTITLPDLGLITWKGDVYQCGSPVQSADPSGTLTPTTTLPGITLRWSSQPKPPASSVVISKSTTLSADIYCTNLTIEPGVTLTTAGYNIYCSGTVKNLGTITTGPSAAQDFPVSYGGSGGGATDLGGPAIAGFATSASGGGTCSASGCTAPNGATPSRPSITADALRRWSTAGMNLYLAGADGGSSAVVQGGAGANGLFIEADTIIAGTINAAGTDGQNQPGQSTAGGGGGGLVILAYVSSLTPGTYDVHGGYTTTADGTHHEYGGNGAVISQQFTALPVPIQ